MAGDNRYFFNEDDLRRDGRPEEPLAEQNNISEEPPEPQSPASVVFMEMMRQQASTQTDEMEAVAVEQEPVAELQKPQLYETAEERRHAAEMEAARLRRVQRRQERRKQQTVGTMAGLFRAVIVVAVSAALIATILSWWTRPESLDMDLRAQLAVANSTEVPIVIPTPVPTPNFLRRIGIVSGHYGKTPDDYLASVDPGAICADGLTENEINFAIAQRVVVKLRDRGYTVDLLEEWDERLEGYEADALVSLHSNDCSDYGELVSGFLVSQAQARPTGGLDERLVNCLAFNYKEKTGLDQRFGLTRDMTDYHIFSAISPRTPGAILELGFMKDDREILTTQQELLADAVVAGVMCYLDPTTTPPVPRQSDVMENMVEVTPEIIPAQP